MSEIYKSIEDFFKKQSQYTIVDLSNKIDPNSKKNLAQNGFFVSEFDFYDLQKSILNGTVQSFLITMGVVFIMMLITTRNILVSLYSLITITLSISATIGTLTLLGWQLSIVESICIILAIGLSIDFSVHFGVTYCNLVSLSSSNRSNKEITPIFFIRENNTKQVIKRIGSPVFMAGITTLFSGIIMTPSPLVYFQLYGVFLIIVIFYSILYSFFLFLPICSVVGPTNSLCVNQDFMDRETNDNDVELNHANRNINTVRRIDHHHLKHNATF